MICRLFTHKVTAIPIFLAVMACVFYITFNTAGRLLENMLSFCVDGAAEALSTILSRLDAPPLLTSLLIGLIVMVLYKPRTWCAFCPMGTMTQSICKLKNKD